jgi:hypothetical protein
MQINPIEAQGAMAAIAAAVTPVVMISANAILISTISAKHQAMSDRVRALTGEWRDPGTSAARRTAISAQVRMFAGRITWISRSHVILYVATVFFLAMVLVIALTPVIQTWAEFSVPLLLGGVLLWNSSICAKHARASKWRSRTFKQTRLLNRGGRGLHPLSLRSHACATPTGRR